MNGRLVKGAAARTKTPATVAAKPTPASIPSRFETVLHEGAQENDGFRSRSRRFTETENEIPGPGQYESITRTLTDHVESASRKGSGGFVSRDTRFGQPRLLRDPLPGPGSYSPAVGFDHIRVKASEPSELVRGFRQKKEVPTASFAPSYAEANVQRTPAPGPGDYMPEASTQATKRGVLGGAASAFRSTSSRTPPSRMANTQADAPAPGAYDPQFDVVRASTITCASAGFRSRSSRETAAAAGLAGGASATPGPGAYNVSRSSFDGKASRKPARLFHFRTVDIGAGQRQAQRMQVQNQQQAALQQQQQRGQPAIADTPGVGTYDTGPKFMARQDVSSAAFKSTTSRFKKPTTGSTHVPGPAYYSSTAQPAMKRSFYNNSSGRWS